MFFATGTQFSEVQTRTFDLMEWSLCCMFTQDIFSLARQGRVDFITILITLSITGQYTRIKY